MNEELVNLDMKKCILDKWKCKLTYSFTRKDLEELEAIIDYYEQENQQLKEDNFKLQARADKYKCRIDKAIEYIEDNFEKEYGKRKEELKKYNLKNCTYEASLVVLGILKGDNNEC